MEDKEATMEKKTTVIRKRKTANARSGLELLMTR